MSHAGWTRRELGLVEERDAARRRAWDAEWWAYLLLWWHAERAAAEREPRTMGRAA